MFNPIYKPVHISTIKAGDVVKHKGEELTVCPSNIKHSSLFGYSIFGDSYHAGHILVLKAFNYHVKPRSLQNA